MAVLSCVSTKATPDTLTTLLLEYPFPQPVGLTQYISEQNICELRLLDRIAVFVAVSFIWQRKKRSSPERDNSSPSDQFEKAQLHSDCAPQYKLQELEACEWQEPAELPGELSGIPVVQPPYEMEDRKLVLGNRTDERAEMQQLSPVDTMCNRGTVADTTRRINRIK
jgi:hypothetical protein